MYIAYEFTWVTLVYSWCAVSQANEKVASDSIARAYHKLDDQACLMRKHGPCNAVANSIDAARLSGCPEIFVCDDLAPVQLHARRIQIQALAKESLAPCKHCMVRQMLQYRVQLMAVAENDMPRIC